MLFGILAEGILFQLDVIISHFRIILLHVCWLYTIRKHLKLLVYVPFIAAKKEKVVWTSD